MVDNQIKRKIYEKYIEQGEKELQDFEVAKLTLAQKKAQLAQLEAEIEAIERNVSGYNYAETRATLEALYGMLDELVDEEAPQEPAETVCEEQEEVKDNENVETTAAAIEQTVNAIG